MAKKRASHQKLGINNAPLSASRHAQHLSLRRFLAALLQRLRTHSAGLSRRRLHRGAHARAALIGLFDVFVFTPLRGPHALFAFSRSTTALASASFSRTSFFLHGSRSLLDGEQMRMVVWFPRHFFFFLRYGPFHALTALRAHKSCISFHTCRFAYRACGTHSLLSSAPAGVGNGRRYRAWCGGVAGRRPRTPLRSRITALFVRYCDSLRTRCLASLSLHLFSRGITLAADIARQYARLQRRVYCGAAGGTAIASPARITKRASFTAHNCGKRLFGDDAITASLRRALRTARYACTLRCLWTL